LLIYRVIYKFTIKLTHSYISAYKSKVCRTVSCYVTWYILPLVHSVLY